MEIDSPDCDFVLSDNYFDMNAGSKTVKILEGKPENIRLRSMLRQFFKEPCVWTGAAEQEWNENDCFVELGI